MSNGSATLVSTPTNYFDSKCTECGMPPLDLDIRPPFSNFVSSSPPASPSTFLKKLPNMKATFKRRGSSFASVSTLSDYERSEYRRTSVDSHATSVSGTDSPRSILVHPYMSAGCKTAPPTAAVFGYRKRNSSTFSNPFSAGSRSRTPPIPAACDDVFSCNASIASSSRPFMRRFGSDTATRTLSSKPHRTDAYAAPYNAERPSSQPQSRSHSKSAAKRTSQLPQTEAPHPPSYLLEEIDAKLSSLQRGREQRRSPSPSPPESDSDVSLDIPRSPTPARTLRSFKAWGAVKRRVARDKRP
ncbi:hypothetical protein FIBSPDRAFT_950405 [Athelia psychrophila]|uniref:Uncharacterized protein n=1 Tax=Athelia psychrophila TaxID=1759441 RepID=A0A166NU34_9AGAM|nr:hypothetical protein FIBSPDRAFT_950405 [Fibularhizoctonia sp. CBS 109695]